MPVISRSGFTSTSVSSTSPWLFSHFSADRNEMTSRELSARFGSVTAVAMIALLGRIPTRLPHGLVLSESTGGFGLLIISFIQPEPAAKHLSIMFAHARRRAAHV